MTGITDIIAERAKLNILHFQNLNKQELNEEAFNRLNDIYEEISDSIDDLLDISIMLDQLNELVFDNKNKTLKNMSKQMECLAAKLQNFENTTGNMAIEFGVKIGDPDSIECALERQKYESK